MGFLANKRALIVGLASNRSIAWGIAQAMKREGAELAFTYQNEKLQDRVEKMAAELGSEIIVPCDVSSDTEIEKVFDHLDNYWDGLDIIVHSVAFAPREELEGDYLDTVTREGFRTAHEISSYSFAALAKAGRNMMVIAREEEQGANVILAALTSLVAQLPPRDLNIHVVDLTTADAPWADYPESLRDAMPHKIEVCGRQRMRDLLPELRGLVKQRHAISDAQSDTSKDFGPRTVLAIIGAHRARELRPSDEMGAFVSFDAKDEDTAPELSACLKELVTDGPDVGVHTMLWLDSYTNFERIFDRRVLGEFGIRISGALPEKDSHTLYDSQIASQITHPNRMVKFDDDLVGVYVMFRPYAVSSEAVFGQIHDRMFAKDSKGE